MLPSLAEYSIFNISASTSRRLAKTNELVWEMRALNARVCSNKLCFSGTDPAWNKASENIFCECLGGSQCVSVQNLKGKLVA